MIRLQSPAAISLALLALFSTTAPLARDCDPAKALASDRVHYSFSGAVQLAGFEQNYVRVVSGAGQVSIVGQALVGRQLEKPRVEAVMEGDALTLYVMLGRNTDGTLWSVPFQARIEGMTAGTQKVVVRYCRNECVTAAQESVTVK